MYVPPAWMRYTRLERFMLWVTERFRWHWSWQMYIYLTNRRLLRTPEYLEHLKNRKPYRAN